MAFAGQANDLLDTPDKLLDYEMSLDNDTLYYFSLLVHSPYHDVSSFTAGEMSMTLYHLMSTLDDQGWDDYLNILDNFDYIPANNMREMLTMWPPKMQLLQTPSTMCDVMGRMDEDLLEDFCLRIADADVSAVTLTEVIERCPDCVVLGFEHRESHDVIFLLDDAKAASYYRKLRQ
ncbi:uncharacterized protein LOC106013177, partial [Aplysia californica]|uniref:Uncharacterized protein LOC106013177 n=1 Tax=Aplysia californica TaxID=6500 RepID=A0ABM1A9Y2_APLCA